MLVVLVYLGSASSAHLTLEYPKPVAVFPANVCSLHGTEEIFDLVVWVAGGFVDAETCF